MFEIIILGALIIWNAKACVDLIRYYRGTKKTDLSMSDDQKAVAGCLGIIICALIPVLYIVVLAVGTHRVTNEYLLILLIASMIFEIVGIPYGMGWNAKIIKSDDPDKEYMSAIKQKGHIAFASFNVVEIVAMVWLFIELVGQALH